MTLVVAPSVELETAVAKVESRAARNATIAVAMSGGLDSSAVASLLHRRGHSVVGLSMLLWDQSTQRVHGRCCGALDLGDARAVADEIGIPHYTLRMDDEFRRHVVDPFVEDYLAGRTPSPCVRCNTWIKFDLFLERADAVGADYIATGHYARIVEGDGEWELHQAACLEKDQSYYLFELTQEQLARSLFPLGALTKNTVRDYARQERMLVAEKGESMEVCFVASGVQQFVEEQAAARPDAFPAPATTPSEIVDTDGKVLGRSSAPYFRYTVGQRRGLGVASSEPLYVLGVDAKNNRLEVGPDRELVAPGLLGERLHWIGRPPAGPVEATVRIRSRHDGVGATIHTLDDGLARVEFETPQRGVAPGQAAVFYEGTRVLGGCWIRDRWEGTSV
ncbi:MAG: tRNA 2-thiouridine(34) synthase MnmA [Acidobacteriota bacterium]